MPSVRTPTTRGKNCIPNSSRSTRMRGNIHIPNDSRASSVLVIEADGKNKTVSPIEDVIEISSDEEETSTTNKDKRIMELENDVKKLRKAEQAQSKAERQLAQHKEELEMIRVETQQAEDEAGRQIAQYKQEIKELRGESGRAKIDASVLEPYILCDICTLIMWHPVILPDCGHVYCEECIQKWFDTIQHNHEVEYPGSIYDLNYTCPMCRDPAFNRPVEVYTMKALVRTVAAAQGERSPRSRGRTYGGNANPVGGIDQWNRFFPLRSDEFDNEFYTMKSEMPVVLGRRQYSWSLFGGIVGLGSFGPAQPESNRTDLRKGDLVPSLLKDAKARKPRSVTSTRSDDEVKGRDLIK
ncbi:hypothetical protein ARMSODRAFT_974474 [Armillaria solidipes]|uniref:RING-type domain-containing protein n=1 Tax=Armillaria solidipes TaxID=1076256 RepID=A0A2H3BWX6_9AGAR|nr:hypothetical protein ARMSODRAFT_974474 [Armillaria solidipes]